MGWDLSRETIQYLKEVYLFDTKEINQHRDLFKQAEKELDILVILAKSKRYAETAKNPKGYIISCIKSELEKHKTEDTQAQNTTSEKPNKIAQKTEFLLEDLAKKMSVK